MKTIRFPLFWKFALAIVLVVMAFGTINLYILWKSVYQSFEKEIDKRCIVLSNIISEKALTPIVYEDVVSLYNLLNDMQRSDESIAYLFLTNSNGQVLAKTFPTKVPPTLLNANAIHDGTYNIEVLEISNFKYKTIRDIAYPILKGDIGVVRLGLVEDAIRDEINIATMSLLKMILLFLAIGLLGAFAFSYLITSPIKRISLQAQQVNLNSIHTDVDTFDNLKYRKLSFFYLHDELDVLVSKFSEMLVRLKDNYAELQKTRDSFVQTEKMAAIGTLASGIGHEINNPISGIKNCAIRISKKPENIEQTLKYINLIHGAADKIEDVTRHLLDFSRKQEIKFEILNPALVLENSIALIEFKAKKAEVKIHKDVQNDLAILGSSNHLEQVILNLLLNSLDAIAERKNEDPKLMGEIHLKLFTHENRVHIQIKDNGTGITEENRIKLFDPFYTTKEAGKGTGLGLYVSFNMIKEHKGEISVNSVLGEGTTFTIDL